MSEIQEFEFDLTIQLPDGAPDIEEVVDALFDAGFDDVVIGTGAPGMIGIAFVRDGVDMDAVIAEATAAALDALPAGSTLAGVTRHD
jgi:hypothetical protein